MTRSSYLPKKIILSLVSIVASGYVCAEDLHKDSFELTKNTTSSLKHLEQNNLFHVKEKKSHLNESISTKPLMIARTFSYNDASKLLKSFKQWNTYLPNKEDQDTTLLLYFSGSFKDYPRILKEFKKLQYHFQSKTEPWHHFFSDLIIKDACLDPKLDIYKPLEQDTNLNWVSGPNLHFQSLLSRVSSGEFGFFEHVFLMEGDSEPVKEYWLDALKQEISEQGDFAVLGSYYQGDNWANFINVLPEGLKYHLNGNAVYNINNPLFKSTLSRLVEENQSEKKATAYDVRIAEILLEDASIEELARFDYKESKVISNYASTYMTKDNLGDEYIAHGRVNRQTWPEDENIDLVVTDFGDNKYKTILRDLEVVSHPFKRVYIIGEDLETEIYVSKSGLENLTRLPTVTIPTNEKPGSTGIEILEILLE